MSKKTIYIDDYCGYVISAVTQDEKLIEFSFEKHGDGSLCGNVYKGRVESVLPGMQAAFIDCGLERNCYFSAEELYPDADAAESVNPPFPELKEGDEVLVQVTKPPVGKKGAKVTTQLSFVGKTVIYLPDTPFIGVSRKISDEELRKNLLFSAKKLTDKNEGVVVRTAAPYAKRRDIEKELEYLRKLYADVKKQFESAAVGELLYSDVSLPTKALRENLSQDIECVIVGSERLLNVLSGAVKISPATDTKIILRDTGRDLFSEAGISMQISEMTSPKVELENGAYLIIEKTEALTSIDVNTGKFVGDYNLEQTVYQTNLLAAREIARQVRLRNIGGIIVVDFIDMEKPAHNKALVAELERALSSDKCKCAVAPMSKFGLVEFTRKRTGTNPVSQMLKQGKNGFVHSPEFTILMLRARLMDAFADGAKSVRIDLNNEIYERLRGWTEVLEDIKRRYPQAEVYACPHKSYGEEQVNVNTLFTLDKAVKLI